MSDEKSNRGARRGKRRYFRPKKEGTAPEQAQAAAPPGRPAEGKPQQPTRQRKARRRARSRQRLSDEVKSQANAEAEVEYVSPKAVFIYTHSAHPEMRDSYEFRPEHFSSVGRRLEDYSINLSSLFVEDTVGPDELPVMKTLPKPDYNWADWEEEG